MVTKHPSWKRDLLRKFILLVVVSTFVLALICLLISLSENPWLRTKRELEARGEVLDWEKYIPPEVSEGQNLFGDPIAAILLPVKGAPIPSNASDIPGFPPDSTDLGHPFTMSTLNGLSREGKPPGETTLASLAEWFGRWNQPFASLREAGKRPFARLPGDYSDPSGLPILNFVKVRELAQVLVSSARVHLLLGNQAAALDDLDTLSVVMRAFDTEPGTLVAAMIRVAIAGLYIDVVEDGLRENLWSDAELRKLVPRLSQMNLLKNVQQGIRAERAATLRFFSALASRRKDPFYPKALLDFSAMWKRWSLENILIRFSPASWVRRNQTHYAGLLQIYIDAIDPATDGIALDQISEATRSFNELTTRRSPNTFLAGLVTPNFSKAAITTARTETRVRQAAIACAIKRFQSEKNRSPENLAELVPDYLSSVLTDVLTGEPMTYRQTADGWELVSKNANPTEPNGTPLDFTWHGN